MPKNFIRQVGLTAASTTAADSFSVSSDGGRGDLRIDFSVAIEPTGAGDITEIAIYNLSPATQSLLIKKTAISLSVGYRGGERHVLSIGTLMSHQSQKIGADTITTLVVSDSYQDTSTSVFNKTYKVATPLTTVLSEALATMPTIGQGELIVPGNVVAGESLSGNTMASISELERRYHFSGTLHNGFFYAIADNLTSNRTFTASGKTGNLIKASPSFTSIFQNLSGINVRTILEPRVVPADNVTVDSVINPEVNGTYQAQTIKHTGSTHSSEWFTDLSLYIISAKSTGGGAA